MCGIAGVILDKGKSNQNLNLLSKNMISKINHRGPDDLGYWSDEEERIGLSHCRLSIVDLSSAGHQPMQSHCNRYVISFNGEIYNHLSLRNSIEIDIGKKVQWNGSSDTETLLKAIEVYGIKKALQSMVGMFAFALWDRSSLSLTLARDRFGEKPLYYGLSNKNFLFASELKAIKAFPDFDNPISRNALSKFLRLNYIPAPLSIYKDIYKLEPGHYITINSQDVNLNKDQQNQYWSLEKIIKDGSAMTNKHSSQEDAMKKFETIFSDAVKLQMQSDVPLGAFLSGGIDSSLIAATMQKNSMSRIKTFTIGFENEYFDESIYAQNVADHLNTDHSSLNVSAQDALNVIPDLPYIYDEPFADSSQIPTYFVCKSAKKSVTVALSGDAGDEIFGGYNRYIWGPKIWKRAQSIPFFLRKNFVKSMSAFSPDTLNKFLNFIKISRPGEKIHKLSQALHSTNSLGDLYNNLISQWHNQKLVKDELNNPSNEKIELDLSPELFLSDPASHMMYMDAMTYLPDDILCKVDRAAMAHSLETRTPFLDHRVAEFAWTLPISMKIKGNQGKSILRDMLYQDVPKNLIERPKTGFSIPLGEWLREPLYEWAENLLDETRLQNEGFFFPEPIRLAWKQHLSKKYDHSAKLWSILMFQAWLEAQT